MKKNYHIEVDCANCANLMEEACNSLNGVESAKINFLTQKISIEFKEGFEIENVMSDVLKSCRKFEPECEIGF